MKMDNKNMRDRENYLKSLQKQKEKALQDAPEGTLRICASGGRVQYYNRTDPKDFNGVYIREKKQKLAYRLAQKDYDKKVLNSIEKELQAIQKYFTSCPIVKCEDIYESLHIERQRLITPIQKSDMQYVQEWESVEYQGKGFSQDIPGIYTAKGERVRSKSEVIIADMLERKGIPYRYEYPICMAGGEIFHRDFTVLHIEERKEMYWEHLGMLDDMDYLENALQKIIIYEKNGIFPGKNLILTYETKKNPLNPSIVNMLIDEYLKND